MDDFVIQSHKGPYRVHFDRSFAGLEDGLAENEYLIVDARVAEIYSKPLEKVLQGRSVLRIEASEANKSLEKFPDYIVQLLEGGVKRGHSLIAVGGGVIQDITSFIAATLMRGVPWSFYPTTLLAQADSCIGSKSSVNVGTYKNQLGTFTPPQKVVIATDVLDSLEDVDIASGIGEMIKVHVIKGWEDFRAFAADYPKIASDKELLSHYILRSLEIKKEKIEIDEFDQNERLIMNYGHSFGHAIEGATDYAVPHGIAVTIGMDMANYTSLKLGFIDQSDCEELHEVLAQNYDGFEMTPIPEGRFFSALSKDKKNLDSCLSLILLRGPGQVFKDFYSNDQLFRDICREYFQRLKKSDL